MSTLAIPRASPLAFPSPVSCGGLSPAGVLLMDSERWNMIAHTGGALKDQASKLVSKYGGIDDVMQIYSLAANLECLVLQYHVPANPVNSTLPEADPHAILRKRKFPDSPKQLCNTVMATSIAGPSVPATQSADILGPSCASAANVPRLCALPSLPSVSKAVGPWLVPASASPESQRAHVGASAALDFIRGSNASDYAESVSRLSSLAAVAFETEHDSDSISGDSASDNDSRDHAELSAPGSAKSAFSPALSCRNVPALAAAPVKTEPAPSAKKPRTRRVRAKAPSKNAALFCHSCGETQTCEWRRGPDGYKSLCNACGIHFAKIVKREEKSMLNYRPRSAVNVNMLLN
eukprot:TRINITY_DN18626_c0_g1_i1.p1 TRINITY_DN18626_c0_g1~~TRINITY_DN18626_c0_g1_i1.p1  ORF type:complete len:349 (-),score=58.84 TRINITY_DN18626_c0_g1_i1:71-1117(-)